MLNKYQGVAVRNEIGGLAKGGMVLLVGSTVIKSSLGSIAMDAVSLVLTRHRLM